MSAPGIFSDIVLAHGDSLVQKKARLLTVAGFLHSSVTFEAAMTDIHYRDLICRAVLDSDGAQLELIVAQLVDAERAREILRAKGYGDIGMNASATAAQLPDAASVRFFESLV